MKLMVEGNTDVKCLSEEKDGNKSYYIEGIFMQANKPNRNGRIYPMSIMEGAVASFNKNMIESGRSVGELGHPEGPSINYERVSHKIESLHFDGENIIGKAKILDTPYGQIVKTLIDEGVQLGVSSRGMGSVKRVNNVNEVQSDFMLATIDVVADPSAPDAFVNGIMENVDWDCIDGSYVKVDAIDKSKPSEDSVLSMVEEFLAKI